MAILPAEPVAGEARGGRDHRLINYFRNRLMCEQCKALRADVKRLERENAKLKRLVKFAKKVIKAQRRQLDDIMIFCLDIIRQAKKIMSQHVPRGTWSLWKGKREIAENIYERTKINYAAKFFELLAEFDL